MVLFERLTPKLVYFHDGCLRNDERFHQHHHNATIRAPLTSSRVVNRHELEIDESDRIPRVLIVRKFDIFCFIFSAVSYILDIGFDVLSAYIHFCAQRFWAFTLISLLIVLPSIALNTIAFVWWIDDSRLASRSYRHCREGSDLQTTPKTRKVPVCCSSVESSSLLFRLFACFFQLGPVLWYVDAIKAAVKFRTASNDQQRRYFYCKMAAADRDASLLRFFEAFLESAPQLLIQGVVLAHSHWRLQPSEPIQTWMYFQLVSMIMSLLSVCWSICIQHRSLRIARPDKLNLSPFETFMQLLWRCLTISSRYLLLVLFVLAFHFWTVLFIVVHFCLSLIHIAALQHVDSQPNFVAIEYGLLLICAIVHLFTPFNMAEGPTRWRYTIAYLIEVVENLMMAMILFSTEQFTYPHKRSIVVLALGMFVCGILIMIVYYSHWHPTGRSAIINNSNNDNAGDKKNNDITNTSNSSSSNGNNTIINSHKTRNTDFEHFNVDIGSMQVVFSGPSTTAVVAETTEVCATLKCSNSEK